MAQRDQGTFMARLWAMEATLLEQGFAPLPMWWRETIERFYRTGKRRLVVRKGRRVFASTSVAPRLAVAEMLFGAHRHLPGTPPHVYAFLSVKRGEATNRLRGVAAILVALGIRYRENAATATLELESYPAVFAVVTANFRTSVGDTVAFAWCDEVARWRDDDAGANPAEQVVGSLAPALATLPDGRLFLVSSPLGPDDFHARAYDLGETELQCVAFGETWTINPSLSKEETQKLEPDEKIWRREYAAIPSAAVSSAFDFDAADRAFRPLPPGGRWQPIGVVDASSGGGDSFTYAIAGYVVPSPPEGMSRYRTARVPMLNLTVDIYGRERIVPDANETREVLVYDERGGGLILNDEWVRAQRPIFSLRDVSAFDGRFRGTLTGEQIVSTIAAHFRRAGVMTVVGDQRESLFLASAFARERLMFREIPWTNEGKAESVRRLRRLFAEDAIVLPPREKLRKELTSYSERVTASGAVVYSARGTGHDDEVALLLTATMADMERLIPGSPLHLSGERHIVSGR